MILFTSITNKLLFFRLFFLKAVMFSDLSAQKEGSSLLCRPASEDQGPVFERETLVYSLCSDRFGVGERSFNRQYAHIYAARLMQMRPLLSERAQQKWGRNIRDSEASHLHFSDFSDVLFSCQDQACLSRSCVIWRQESSVALWGLCSNGWTCSHLSSERSARRLVAIMQSLTIKSTALVFVTSNIFLSFFSTTFCRSLHEPNTLMKRMN